MILAYGALAAYSLMSLVTFIAFWLDKRRAQRDRWRISERTLLTLSLLFGWPGAMLAMKLVRHKTRTRKFTLGVPMIAVLHAITWGLLIYWAKSPA